MTLIRFFFDYVGWDSVVLVGHEVADGGKGFGQSGHAGSFLQEVRQSVNQAGEAAKNREPVDSVLLDGPHHQGNLFLGEKNN